MPSAAVGAEYARCRDWLVAALVEDTEEALLKALDNGTAQLWPGDDAAFVTQLVNGPEPFILVWLGGGSLRGLLQMRPGIEAWARAQGAKAARINGRIGWARALRAYGFKPVGDELRKAL